MRGELEVAVRKLTEAIGRVMSQSMPRSGKGGRSSGGAGI